MAWQLGDFIKTLCSPSNRLRNTGCSGCFYDSTGLVIVFIYFCLVPEPATAVGCTAPTPSQSHPQKKPHFGMFVHFGFSQQPLLEQLSGYFEGLVHFLTSRCSKLHIKKINICFYLSQTGSKAQPKIRKGYSLRQFDVFTSIVWIKSVAITLGGFFTAAFIGTQQRRL